MSNTDTDNYSIDQKIALLEVVCEEYGISKAQAISYTGKSRSYGYRLLSRSTIHKFIDLCMDRVEQKHRHLN